MPRLLKQRWRHGPGDHGADVAFQCRGQDSALATALAAVRPQATVVDLAFYQGGTDEVRLGEEFHHNGLSLRCAQISRVPRGQAHLWDRARLSAETVALLRARGADAVRTTHLVTDVLPLAEAPRAARRPRRAARRGTSCRRSSPSVSPPAPVAPCGAPTGLDSGDPRCRR